MPWRHAANAGVMRLAIATRTAIVGIERRRRPHNSVRTPNGVANLLQYSPNTMILTSNTPVNNWDEFFTDNETLLCVLDRVFDRATVFMMKGASFRGAELETFSVESTPMAAKLATMTQER